MVFKDCGIVVKSLKMDNFLWILFLFISMHAICKGVAGQPDPPVRLADGPRASEGRLEVYLNDQWGTVCYNQFSIREADVVCKQLGYPEGADRVIIDDRYEEAGADVQVFLDDVKCDGDETDLLACARSTTPADGCDHTKDVGVVCTSTGSIRLQNGEPSYIAGRLEILGYNGEWGTVCSNAENDFLSAFVACVQLELVDGLITSPYIAGDGTGPIGIGGLNCTGIEERLDDCSTTGDGTPDDTCTHENDLGARCSPPLKYKRGSQIPTVYYGGKWGSICADNWNYNTARIFCINTGREDALVVGTVDRNSNNSILLNPITCTGDEAYYTECPDVEWAYQDGCVSPQKDPWVSCQRGKKKSSIFESPDFDFPEYGRVYVEANGIESSVCNRTWNQEAANVVCKENGHFRGARRFFNHPDFRSLGIPYFIVDNIRCTGDEEIFSDCRSEFVIRNEECNHRHDVGVECFANDDSILTFLSGAGDFEGVVHYRDVSLQQQTLLCDATWTNTEAAVACRMGGYSDGTAIKVVDLKPENLTEVFEWDIECTGEEERLEDCTIIKADSLSSCAPENIAQVRCGPRATEVASSYRMSGSDYAEQGRLEYFTGDEWVQIWINESTPLTVYHDLCRSMGYETDLYHYNGVDGMPFEAATEGARLVCGDHDGAVRCEELSSDDALATYYQTGIVCKPYDSVANHPIRLKDRDTGEINNQSGVVQIYNDGEWGDICQYEGYYYFSEKVCIELGYDRPEYTTLLLDSNNGTSDRQWFSIVRDTRYDTCGDRLYGCPHTAWGSIDVPGDVSDGNDCIALAVSCVDSGASSISLMGFSTSLIVIVVISLELGF